jgi:predicted RNA-binding Zn-ribbon protein involved in translation (DUF1610 family)
MEGIDTSAEYKCETCNWVGSEDELLSEYHPFIDNNLIYGCPDCGAIINEEK